MPTFDVTGSRAPAATQSPLNITGSATLRPRITHVRAGTTGIPSSEASVQVYGRLSTTAGTGTSVTPGPRNGISVAGCTALSNLSAEPTYTAGQPKVVLEFNPRLFAQWTAYDLNAAIEGLAVTANGIGFQTQVAGGALTTVDVDVDLNE